MRALATSQPSATGRKRQTSARVTPAPTFNPLSSLTIDTPFLQRKEGCACGGGCPNCREGVLIQPKLRIGQPNDKYEQEADRLADQVMRMPEPGIQRQPS